MRTIVVTIDETTWKLLDALHCAQPGRKQSAVVRVALREFAERERQRGIDERERHVFRKNRKQLERQASALIRAQTRA